MRAALPNRRLVVALLRRATVLWLSVRFAIGIFAMVVHVSPLFLPEGSAIVAVLLTGSLGVADTSRRGEWVFWGNLAQSPAVIGGLLFSPALCGELALQTIRALVT